MATISSLGIGSGLDSNGIVSKLVALEKQPLVQLQTKAQFTKSQISSVAKIKSEFSALADAASAMTASTAWSARTATSSNTAAATITVDSTAQASSISLDVDQLAAAQNTTSAAYASGTLVGAGTLSIQLGTWSGTGTKSFAAGSAAAVSVSVDATDTISSLAAKINKANAGVTATTFNDGTQDRLVLRSSSTGEAKGFKITAADSSGTALADGTGLSRFAFDPSATTAYGMAASTAGTPTYGQDAKARINGLAVTSSTNTLANNIPGVTINLLTTTTTNYGSTTTAETKSPVTLSVKEDVTVAVKSIQSFITAYNTLLADLKELTKYDPNTKVAGSFQGDATILGMQKVLQSIRSSSAVGSSAYTNLTQVGVTQLQDGSLSMDTTKLAAAANNGTELQKLFTTDNSNDLTNGFAIKFRDFARGAVNAGGVVDNKDKALAKQLKANTTEQDKVTARAEAVQARLIAQYSALDGKMAGINALSEYVKQQVTTWNKSTS